MRVAMARVKLTVQLSRGWTEEYENLHAYTIGENIYQIDQIPLKANGINMADIVHASIDKEGQTPIINKVVEWKGHRTLRMRFDRSLTVNDQDELLTFIQPATVQRMDDQSVIVDLLPTPDFRQVCYELQNYESKALLVYEIS